MVADWPTRAGEDFDAAIAARMNAISKTVVSRTQYRAEWANTRVIHDDVAAQLTELKRQPGKDIAIFGSSALTADLLALGLVDELRLMVNPVILGHGAPLLAGAPTTPVASEYPPLHLRLRSDDLPPRPGSARPLNPERQAS